MSESAWGGENGRGLAANEERYLLAEEHTDAVYAMPWMFRLRGALDAHRLHSAIQTVCDRHEALNQTYRKGEDGHWYAYRMPPQPIDLPVVDAPSDQWPDIAQYADARSFAPVDLRPDSLRRFQLQRVCDEDHVLTISLHHTIGDGMSLRLLVREIFDTYHGKPAEGVARPFSDFVDQHWRDGANYTAARDHFQDALQGFDDARRLAEDLSGKGEGGPAGVVRVEFQENALARWADAARAVGVSPFIFLYAVTTIILSRTMGSREVVSAFQSHGRRAFPGSQDTIGSFSNALVVGQRVDPATTAGDYLRQLGKQVRGALAHESFPYHDFIALTGIHPRVGVNWYPEFPELSQNGLSVERYERPTRQSDYDLNFRFMRENGRLALLLFYRSAGFSHDRIEALAGTFEVLANAMADGLSQPLAALPSSASLAAPAVLADLQAPLASDGEEPIYAAFLRAASATPDRRAIEYRGDSITYAALEARSRQIADVLVSRGFGPGKRVAILATRSPAFVAALLGVARSGASFLVLDTAYPQARLETYCQIARPDVLLHLPETQEGPLAEALAATTGLGLLDGTGGTGDAPIDDLDPDSVAYFLFTSGTTGEPKCVANRHGPLTHFVAWQRERFGFSPDDRFTLCSGLAHDPVLRDVFAPLSCGASLLIPDQQDLLGPGTLRRWFIRNQPTVSHLTPPLGQLLVAGAEPNEQIPSLSSVFWGGDQLTPPLVAAVHAVAPHAAQINFYGATETPQAASFYPIEAQERPWRSFPVGKGSSGFQLGILNADGAQLGVGEQGEIVIRSPWLSLGYVENGAVPQGAHGARQYRTGDLGFTMPDGNVVLVGRSDDQIKVRGHRVDLSEVSTALAACADVSQSAVIPVDRNGERQLAAFVVAASGKSPSRADIQKALSDLVPIYMVPQSIHFLEALPLLPSGKLDRKALARLDRETLAGSVAPVRGHMSELERDLASAWAACLGRPVTDPALSFVDLGGDSLSLVDVFMATEKLIGVVPEDWQFRSISELAGMSRQKSRFWSSIDTTMLVRAIAIFLVVSGHFHLLSYGGGATTALFLVSGYLFGSLQLEESFLRGTARPAVNLLLRILLPVALFSWLLVAAKLVAHSDTSPSTALFYANFFDYTQFKTPNRSGVEFYLWYIHCAFQILVIAAAALLALHRWGRGRIAPLGFCLILVAVGAMGRFILPGIIDPDFFAHGAHPLEMVNYLPTTHLGTFFLGAAAAQARKGRERLLLLAIAVLYTVVSLVFYSPVSSVFLLVFALMLLFVSRVRVPRILARVILLLSGGSLFIYLTHFQWLVVFRGLGLEGWPIVTVPLAIAGGIGVWTVWQAMVKAVVGLRSRRERFDEAAAAL